MALTFFWRCEDTTLDATHDFSAGATTASANNTPSISATAARIGSNGLLFDSVADQYRFNPASIWDRLTGSAAFSVRFPTALPGANQPFFLCRGAASFNDTINIDLGAPGEVRLNIRDATAGGVTLQTTSADLEAGGWYAIVPRWDQPNDRRRLEVYDALGALIEAVEDVETAFTAPASLDESAGFRIGDNGGSVGTCYIDNVFVSDAYDEPLQNNLTIASYTEYDDGSGSEDTPPTVSSLGTGGFKWWLYRRKRL